MVALVINEARHGGRALTPLRCLQKQMGNGLKSMLGYPSEPLEPLNTSAVPKQDKAEVTIQYW